MINPSSPTKYNRSQPELETFVLWATILPTKPAHRMAQLLDSMLMNGRLHHSPDLTPFELVRVWVANGTLEEVLRRYNVGQYTRLVRCWTELTAIQLARPHHGNDQHGFVCTKGVDLKSVAELEQIHGIGPKTARFIVLHNVKNARCIPVDTHWLKELRSRGYPVRENATLDARLHAEYERYALAEVDASGQTAAAYDLSIWLKWNRATQQRAAA